MRKLCHTCDKCPKINVLSPQVMPKYPSLHIHMNVSMLTSMQLPPLSQGDLMEASQGTESTFETSEFFHNSRQIR